MNTSNMIQPYILKTVSERYQQYTRHTDMAIFTNPLHVDIELFQGNSIHPEKKAVCVINKVIVPASIIVYIEDKFGEFIQGDTTCLFRFLDESRGGKNDFFFFLGVIDITLCEYTLGIHNLNGSVMHMSKKPTNPL